MRTTGLVSFSALVALAACSDVSGPPVGLKYAIASFTCGPADGPATVIDLARNPILDPGQPGYPYLEIFIQRSLAEVTGTWPVGQSSPDATAIYVSSAKFQPATAGHVTVERVGADSTVEGNLDMWFGMQHIVGQFSASWIRRNITCA